MPEQKKNQLRKRKILFLIRLKNLFADFIFLYFYFCEFPFIASCSLASSSCNVTEPGDQYQELNETYVIFITENDVLGANLPIYHVDRIIRETGKMFNDESHIIYVNKLI